MVVIGSCMLVLYWGHTGVTTEKAVEVVFRRKTAHLRDAGNMNILLCEKEVLCTVQPAKLRKALGGDADGFFEIPIQLGTADGKITGKDLCCQGTVEILTDILHYLLHTVACSSCAHNLLFLSKGGQSPEEKGKQGKCFGFLQWISGIKQKLENAFQMTGLLGRKREQKPHVAAKQF